MQSTTDRRQMILEYLLDNRHATRKELAEKFGVSTRTIQGDIQMMRSDKLGYNAPIEVYEHKYYRYADTDYSITNMPISQNDYEAIQ